MKKGFLANIKKPLYEKAKAGVENGEGGSSGRVMEKLRVIDMTQSSPTSLCNSNSSDSSSRKKNILHSATKGFSPECDVLKLSQVIKWIDISVFFPVLVHLLK